MTPFSFPGRLTPALLRPVVLEDVPEGWEHRSFEAARDGDPLTWLGFEPGEPDEPILAWPQPARWPAPRRRTSGRHRAPALRTA